MTDKIKYVSVDFKRVYQPDGSTKAIKGRERLIPVTRIYSPTRVGTASGDVFNVKADPKGRADYMAVS